MAAAIQRPRGTHDIVPPPSDSPFRSDVWDWLSDAMRDFSRRYGFARLEPPIFEHTELFRRGVGETTDVVEKEMYTFEDRAGRSVTLRPEFTAGVVRAHLELGLSAAPSGKWYSIGPVFRYDKPQAGRYRQFHQWNVEIFGVGAPGADAELIELGLALARRVGLERLVVSLNSLGCAVCRPRFLEALVAFLTPRLERLCADCQQRLVRNPLRLLDCKRPVCTAERVGAPSPVDYLCRDCRDHLDGVLGSLARLGVAYRLDPALVRGLDYYTRTVFEVKYPPLGAQDALWGGGRYDGLIELLGGPPTPGVGFAVGLERMLLALAQLGKLPTDLPGQRLDVFFAPIGELARQALEPVVQAVRQMGLRSDLEQAGRSLKAMLRSADRRGAALAVIAGEAEVARGQAVVRDLASAQQKAVPFADLPLHLAQARDAYGARGTSGTGPSTGDEQGGSSSEEDVR